MWIVSLLEYLMILSCTHGVGYGFDVESLASSKTCLIWARERIAEAEQEAEGFRKQQAKLDRELRKEQQEAEKRQS